MKIGITANPQKPKAVELARQAVARVGDKADVVVSEETASVLGTGLPSSPLEALTADALIAIGGDGTFLYALQQTTVPLLPVNAGTFGFLAEVDGGSEEAFTSAIDRLLRGDYLLESRMKLASHVAGTHLPDATNEVVVHTSQVAKMRRFEIAVSGEPVGELRADGVILGTPTGSTSYALSAMGPIVDPGVPAIVIAALAPFRASPRTVVVDPLKTVTVRLMDPGKEGVLVVDGQGEHPLPGGESVTVYRSTRQATFVRFHPHFFDRLRGKKILPWTDVEPRGASHADLPTST
ncbi:MAG: NAD(+)/NADH kinase [Thermoplasmata archaeon]|nr:NAD(+)/NADH kinase [Thermoplasmata archaeon]